MVFRCKKVPKIDENQDGKSRSKSSKDRASAKAGSAENTVNSRSRGIFFIKFKNAKKLENTQIYQKTMVTGGPKTHVLWGPKIIDFGSIFVPFWGQNV